MTRQKGDLTAAERTKHVRVGRLAEGSLERNFVHIGQARHGVQTTPADNSNLCLQWIHLKAGVQNIDYTKQKMCDSCSEPERKAGS